MIVSRGDKKLRNLPLVQIFAYGKVARSSERTEHQQDIVFLNKTARKIHGGHWIGFVIVGDKLYLAAVDPASLIQHLKIRGFSLPDGAEGLQISTVRHEIADTNFSVGHALVAHSLRDRAETRQRQGDGYERSDACWHSDKLDHVTVRHEFETYCGSQLDLDQTPGIWPHGDASSTF